MLWGQEAGTYFSDNMSPMHFFNHWQKMCKHFDKMFSLSRRAGWLRTEMQN